MQKKPRFQRNKTGQNQIYINEKIKAFNIMLVAEGNEEQATIPRAKALRIAEEAWLDLVQVSYNPKDKVSICKIVDYGKHQYELKKKAKDKKKTQKKMWLKEIKLSYSIWENDLNLKIEKIKKLLLEGYSVRVVLRLRWRENIFKLQAKKILENVNKLLEEYGRTQWVKDEWRGFSAVLFAKVR